MKTTLKKTQVAISAVTFAVTLAAALLLPAAALADARVNSELENITGNVAVLNFGQIGPVGTLVPNGKAATAKGISGVLAFQGGGSGKVGQQGNGWNGNFLPGDLLLWTNSPGQGPLVLLFDTGLKQVGAQIQTDAYGPFVAGIAAYDGNNNLLGFFTEAGVSNGNADGSAIFLGVDDDVPEIRTLVYSIESCAHDCNDFAISSVTVSTGVTPEPGTLALFGSGVIGLGGLLRRRFRG